MTKPLLCRIGLHDFEDFPDPNTESGGLEKQGYRACTRCTRVKDKAVYLTRSGQRWMPNAGRPATPEGKPLKKRKDSSGS
ncbi:MAG: hypothetical protein WKF57_19020 [Nakamurella sp.]